MESSADFEALLHHLKETRGFDFTAYKRATLMRRVLKRMDAVGVNDFADYVDYLEVHQDEFPNLFNTILINVTGFYRDPPAWDYLEREVVPRIIASKTADQQIRVWCAGCASGEEAYTVAMVLAEALGPDELRRRVKIYATDVDEEELSQARLAVYSARAVNVIAPELRERYFEGGGDRYTFRRQFRRAVIFGRHDLLQDAPISRIDLLTSRNTLMYFNADAQAKILARFFHALQEGGYLFLGKAETLQARASLFTPLEMKHRIFTKPVTDANIRERMLLADSVVTGDEAQRAEELYLQELAFQTDTVAQIAVDPHLTLVLANAEARSLFGLSQRDLGRPLQDLEASYRPVELRSLIEKALEDGRPAGVSEVYYPRPDNAARWYDVKVVPLVGRRSDVIGIRVSFVDVTRARELARELQQSRSELETAYEELQSSNEELETTNEELQSTVEELETTNEELQSTNEELETMNEELQSTNEELEAVNDELRERGEQLDGANSFLESILAGLRAGVAAVDKDMTIRAWNHSAEELWGLRTEEARGARLLNLDIGLGTQALLQPVRECLAGRLDNYEAIVEATNRRGRRINCRVSINGMKPSGEQASGAIIVMEEVENGA